MCFARLSTKATFRMSSDVQQSPRSADVSYVCDCGREFTATVHHAVNVTLEPHLLYALLAGKLNVATCPNCGRQITSELPFIYHDMKRGLFAYVHPNKDLEDEDRQQMLTQLQRVYTQAVRQSERMSPPRPAQGRPRSHADHEPGAARQSHGVMEPETPPMQVIFGVDQLVALVESLLEPEERLGHIALNTRSHDPVARERFLSVAGRLAQQAGCQVETAERSGALVVDIYGPRSRIGQLVTILQSAS